jgi:2-oxo-3-hexenedioate decarboxylase
MDDATVQALAAEALDLLGTGRQTSPFSARHRDLDAQSAYRIVNAMGRLRTERRERAVGRKVGFTNRNIWSEYKVYSPVWGWMYDSTVHEIGALPDGFALTGLPEPKIEPEIVFGLRARPEPDMEPADLLQCIDWIAHGFEIVQSVFPGWVFTAADTIAAHGLHGALLLGPRRLLGDDRSAWLGPLSSFEIDLLRNGELADHGRAANVLDGPLLVLQHLARVLADDPVNPPLSAGEIVTTGTLTRAFPVAPGETWTTRLHGLDLPPLSMRFR